MSLSQKIKLQPGRDVVELPNGDLMYTDPGPERPDTIAGSVQVAPKGSAKVDAALADPNHPSPACPWCGQTPGDEGALRAHIIQRHAAAVGAQSRAQQEAEVSAAAKRGRLTPASVKAAVARVFEPGEDQ